MATARMSRTESKAATRSELLDAAHHVFVRRGYHGASLDLVASEAGYTKGAVYSAFGSKGRMFLAVWEREVDRRWSRIEGDLAVSGPAAMSADWFERLRAQRDWTVVLLEFRLHAARDPELNAEYAEGHRRVLARFGTLLERNGVPADRAAELALDIVALSNGWALEHLAVPDDATEARYAAAATTLVDAFRR